MTAPLIKKLPLTCPFCDEPAMQMKGRHRVVTDHKIYTWRQCTMGHILVSVEEIPEDQSAVVQEIKYIKESRNIE